MTRSSDRWDFLYLWVVPLGVLGAGIAILISGIGRSDREAVIAASEMHAIATVEDVHKFESAHGKGGTSYRYTSTVEFTLANGETFTTTLDSEADSDAFVVGEKVPVSYAAIDPTQIVADERRWDYRVTVSWGWALTFAGVILTAALVFGTVRWQQRKKRPRPRRR